MLSRDGTWQRHAWPLASSGPQRIGGLASLPMVGSRGDERWLSLRQIWRSNPWVHAAVNVVAQTIARTPLHVFRREGEVAVRVRDDVATPGRNSTGQVLARLLRAPNDFCSGVALLRSTMTDRLVFGNALWVIERDLTGTPAAIWYVPWEHVTVVTGGELPVIAYEVRPFLSADARAFAPDDVVHFGRTADGGVGTSPLAACRHTVALHEALVRSMVAFFENAARPSAHLKVDRVTDEIIQRIRAQIDLLYASPENAGRVLVTSGDWQPIATKPSESEVVELVRLSREEIVAAYGVPPPVVGMIDDAIKANVVELRRHFVRDVVGSYARELESEMRVQLIDRVPSLDGHWVEFQLAEQLRPDLEARATVYERMAMFLTPNEIRGLENLPPLPIPEADVPWVKPGAVPMGSSTASSTGSAASRRRRVRRDADGWVPVVSP